MAIENAEQARALVQRLESDNTQNAAKIAALEQKIAEMAQERALSGQPLIREAARAEDFIKGDKLILQGTDDDGVYRAGLLDAVLPGEKPVLGDWQEDVLRTLTDYNILRLVNPKLSGVTSRTGRKLARLMEQGPDKIRAAAFGPSAGSGLEWMPQNVLLPRLEMEYRESVDGVLSLFEDIPIASMNIKLPWMAAGGITPYIQGLASTTSPAPYTPSMLTTAERSFEPTRLVIRVLVDDDAAEDSLIPALPMLRMKINEAMSRAEVDAIINGDTGTHQDTALASWNPLSSWLAAGLGSPADHRRAWIGLRARAFDLTSATVDNGSAQTVDGINSLISLLAVDQQSENVVLLTNSGIHNKKLRRMDGVTKVNEYGPGATIRSGQLIDVMGYPVVRCNYVTSDLQATGLFTTTGGTKGSVIAVHTPSFKRFSRRAGMFEAARDISTGTTALVMSMRRTFGSISGSSINDVAVGYNWG